MFQKDKDTLGTKMYLWIPTVKCFYRKRGLYVDFEILQQLNLSNSNIQTFSSPGT